MPPPDSLESTVVDSLPSTRGIMEEEEDEKKGSENAEVTSLGMDRDGVSGWSPMVFTQMEVTVRKSSKVWVHDESWCGNERKVQFKYDHNGNGTVYQGMRWKFSEMEGPTGMGALDAMAMKVLNLEETVRGMRRQLDAKDAELERIRNTQNEGLTALIEKLSLKTDEAKK